jgi:hypothetical protein
MLGNDACSLNQILCLNFPKGSFMAKKLFYAIAIAGILCLYAAGTAVAAELLIYDKKITITESDHGFIFFAAPTSAGTNWKSPNNYYTGMWYGRYEVFSYPQPTQSFGFSHCVWGASGTETCCSPKFVKGPGVFFQTPSSPSTWWTKNSGPDFTNTTKWEHLGIPLWTSSGNMSDWNNAAGWAERAKFLPCVARITIVAVSSGSTFSGWDTYIKSTAVMAESMKPESNPASLKITGNAQNKTTIIVNLEKPYSVEIFDISGRCVVSYRNSGAGKSPVAIHSLKPGLYIARVRAQAEKISQVFLVD